MHFSVNNVLNMYGTMVLITITGVSTFIIISHYRDIFEEVKGGKKITGSLVPKEWFILIGFTIICVFLPFVKSHALRFELFMSKINHCVSSYHVLFFKLLLLLEGMSLKKLGNKTIP